MSSAAPMREIRPPEMDQHRVAWLTTEDGKGWTTLTRIRFATDGGKIYTSLGRESLGFGQVLGRPEVRVSLGKGNRRVRGPEIAGVASVLPEGEISWARHLMARKYWWLRVPWLWSRESVLVEIELV